MQLDISNVPPVSTVAKLLSTIALVTSNLFNPPPVELLSSPTLVLYFPLLSFFIVAFIPSTVTSNGKLLSVKSSFIGFIPSTLFKFVFNCPKFIFPVSSKLAAIAKSTFSFTVALSFCVFALCALVNIPLSPVNVAIVTPASIKSTIIVMTNAINVIPFFPLPFLLTLISFVLYIPSTIYFYYPNKLIWLLLLMPFKQPKFFNNSAPDVPILALIFRSSIDINFPVFSCIYNSLCSNSTKTCNTV